MSDPLESLIHRDTGDVAPESVPYLRQPNAWGWNLDHGISAEDIERSMDPLRRWVREECGPDEGSFARGLLWGIPVSVALWAVLIWVLSIVLRWWR